MKTLLNTIRDRLKADTSLSYLRWVEVVDDESILPEGYDFPGAALKDDGQKVFQFMFPKKDEQLRVRVVPVVVLLRGVGSSVMGDTSLTGGAGKGVLDISDEIATSLKFTADSGASAYKTALTDAGYMDMLPPDIEPSQTLVSPDGDRLIQKRPMIFSYLRRVDI